MMEGGEMADDRLWVMLTTIVICAMVVWGVDTDGRYLQQMALWCAGVISGTLLTYGGEE